MNQEPRPPSMRPGRGDARRCWSQTGVSVQHTGVSGLPHRSLRSISGPTPEPAPGTARSPLRRRHRRLTGVSGPDRSLRTSTPESPDRVNRACAPQVTLLASMLLGQMLWLSFCATTGTKNDSAILRLHSPTGVPSSCTAR